MTMRRLGAVLVALSLMAMTAQAQERNMSEDVNAVALGLEKYTQETLLGDLWKRPSLSARDRSIVTLAALIARNQTVEMASYVNRATVA
jgi:4-carboxymuconolactone decarboxylase